MNDDRSITLEELKKLIDLAYEDLPHDAEVLIEGNKSMISIGCIYSSIDAATYNPALFICPSVVEDTAPLGAYMYYRKEEP